VVVGTPIGNLGDLSPRARDVLETADLIACEDTRRTGRLLQLVGIAKRPLIVANEHTELARAPSVIEHIQQGRTVALVSDAGMPTISDPGYRLVSAVIAAGLDVQVVPGPTAISAALAVSGLATNRFVFEGFLPRRGQERAARLAEVAKERRATVIYESPGRLLATLDDLTVACGAERRVSVARELTKLHEEVVGGTLAEVLSKLHERAPRGEYAIVVDGAAVADAEPTDDEIRSMLTGALSAGDSKRDAVAAVVEATGLPKRKVYEIAIAMA